jgi:DNA invertase Pin-like site-specific DNA recombinase
MENAIGYIRVSTSSQAEEGISMDVQSAKIRAYCELNDINLLEIVEDAGISGKSISKRPGITRVLDLVKRRKIQHFVVYKLDRMSRNLKEAIEISDLMKKSGVHLHSITEKIDTGSATGNLFFNMLNAMAQWEREIISERTSASLQLMKARGEKISSRAPFGFKFNGNKVVSDTNEQKAIMRIKTLASQGLSERKLIHRLASEGILNRSGNPFTRSTIRTVTAA